MSAYIEPTVSEFKEGFRIRLAAQLPSDPPWIDILDASYKRMESARINDEDGWGEFGHEYFDLVDMLIMEGVARKYPKVTTRRFQTPIQAAYVALRMDGQPHKLAEMFAFQQPPMSNTDREFLEGHCNGNQFEGSELVGNWYKKQARKAGVDTTGKVYINGLAAFPGDPRAWVSGRGDAEAIIRERNWSCDGSIKIKGRQEEGNADVRVADDIVFDRMLDRVEAEPHLALKGHEALFEETREQIQPHWTD